MKTREELIDELIDLAFAEDIGDGDATTLCCIPADEMGRSRLIVKEEGIPTGLGRLALQPYLGKVVLASVQGTDIP